MTQHPADVALAVKRLQHRHHRALSEALRPWGVSLVQWDTLRHLHARPGSSLHDLAVLTFQTDQSFGALAARMAEKGLIKRVAGPGRAVRHRLTDEGERIREAGQLEVDAVFADSFSLLSGPEVVQLGGLLVKALGEDSTGLAAD